MERFELPTAMYFLENLSLFANKLFSSLRRLNLGTLRINSGRNELCSLKIPDSMESLEELHLMENQFKHLDFSSMRMPRLRLLYLDHNELESIELPEELDSL
jgi:Leucine-rich repeat (LRR) protein